MRPNMTSANHTGFLRPAFCLTGLFLIFSSCHRNPITGRKQLSLVSENSVQAMALTQYSQFISTNKVAPPGNKDAEMVKRVGTRIADAITRYYGEHRLTHALNGYK